MYPSIDLRRFLGGLGLLSALAAPTLSVAQVGFPAGPQRGGNIPPSFNPESKIPPKTGAGSGLGSGLGGPKIRPSSGGPIPSHSSIPQRDPYTPSPGSSLLGAGLGKSAFPKVPAINQIPAHPDVAIEQTNALAGPFKPKSLSETVRLRQSDSCKSAIDSMSRVLEANRLKMGYPAEYSIGGFIDWYLAVGAQHPTSKAAAEPVLKEQKVYEKACLTTVIPDGIDENKVKNVVGILFNGENVFCTGYRIAQDEIRTARHCFITSNKGGLPYAVEAAQGKRKLYFMYEGEPDKKFEIDRTSLPQLIGLPFSPEKDYVKLKIEKTANPVPTVRWSSSPPERGDSLYLRAYFELADGSEPLDKMRSTAHGGCSVTYVSGNCVFHACQTANIMSGAPIFARPEPSDASNELTIVAIHLGAGNLAPPSLCQVNTAYLSANNFGYYQKE